MLLSVFNLIHCKIIVDFIKCVRQVAVSTAETTHRPRPTFFYHFPSALLSNVRLKSGEVNEYFEIDPHTDEDGAIILCRPFFHRFLRCTEQINAKQPVWSVGSVDFTRRGDSGLEPRCYATVLLSLLLHICFSRLSRSIREGAVK